MVYIQNLASAIGSIALLNLPAALAQGSISYMPFGDSITEFGCWRAEVWQKLQDDGYTDIDFVGSMNSDTQCGSIDYDNGHEGHAGFLAIDIANNNQLVDWLQQNPADVITMHLGTNDIVGGHSSEEIIGAFDTLVDQMRESNPAMRIIIAQIIPLSFNNEGVIDLNEQIPAFVESKTSAESPILLVDQFTGFEMSDLGDGVHPNASGDTKIADKWYPALVEAIDSLQSGGGSVKRGVKFVV